MLRGLYTTGPQSKGEKNGRTGDRNLEKIMEELETETVLEYID
jgi:hypothetical protein